jgi:hypothetical protein
VLSARQILNTLWALPAHIWPVEFVPWRLSQRNATVQDRYAIPHVAHAVPIKLASCKRGRPLFIKTLAIM